MKLLWDSWTSTRSSYRAEIILGECYKPYFGKAITPCLTWCTLSFVSRFSSMAEVENKSEVRRDLLHLSTFTLFI
jgi:hypothetical protein